MNVEFDSDQIILERAVEALSALFYSGGVESEASSRGNLNGGKIDVIGLKVVDN